jgi:hypothetical protein
VLSLTSDDSRDQTKAVLMALAEEAREADLTLWHQLQEWLEDHGERRVNIPYARALARLMPPVAVRLRRDFAAVLSLIRAHALLHQQNRGLDQLGRIVANLDDFSDLVASLVAEGVGATVSAATRENGSGRARLGQGNWNWSHGQPDRQAPASGQEQCQPSPEGGRDGWMDCQPGGSSGPFGLGRRHERRTATDLTVAVR